jgi:hypothetical protein
VIPNLQEIARELGLNPAFVAIAAAATLTAGALFAQGVANWFDDTNSKKKS